MLDPTNRTKDVIHFMIPKPVVLEIAQQVTKSGQAEDGLMKFTLRPSIGQNRPESIYRQYEHT